MPKMPKHGFKSGGFQNDRRWTSSEKKERV